LIEIRIYAMRTTLTSILIRRGKKSAASQKRIKYVDLRKSTKAEEIARDYFDAQYPKLFKNKWPSVRCAMMSRKKYCCVLNNYVSDNDRYLDTMAEAGAYDFLQSFRQKAREKHAEFSQEYESLKSTMESAEAEDSETANNEQTQELTRLQKHRDEYKSLQHVCENVKAFVHKRRDLSEFRHPPVNSSRLLSGFHLEASSVLPVLALNPKSNDSILDMCSAPGGKLNIILQAIGDSGYVVANDIDKRRISRLKKVIREYIPAESSIHSSMKLVSFDGGMWSEIEREGYDKVLIDAPCTTDRVSINVPETEKDNIFSVYRKKERARLPQVQVELLKNGVLACQPGGTIVYSTCTASPLQNEFVLQYALQELCDVFKVECIIKDLKCMATLLQDEMNFHENMKPGLLVYPTLDANFGPMFICKLQRVT